MTIQIEHRWCVYVLVSDTLDRTYVGCTVDIDRRLNEHNGIIKGGAKSTRCGRPWKVGIIYGPYVTRSEAQTIEAKVKSLRGQHRMTYCQSM